MQNESWTLERIDLLKKLWGEGATATAIAARLGGISRAAVLGKIFRLRLGPAKRAQKPDSSKSATTRERRNALPPTADKPSGAPQAVLAQDVALKRRRVPRRYKPRQPPRLAKRTRGETLFELTNTSCRWPFGQPGTKKFHFCGAPEADLEAGMPYCPLHARRAYLAEPPRKADRVSASDSPSRPYPMRARLAQGQRFVFGPTQRRARY
jgi:GcrA cell cycle regulator